MKLFQTLFILMTFYCLTDSCKSVAQSHYSVKNVDGSDSDYIVDIDSNSYKIGKIGAQLWMKENLRTGRFSNGDPIKTTGQDNLNIADEPAPEYQWVYDRKDSLLSDYGRLYTWHAAVDPRNVCPEGWRVPLKDDFIELSEFAGGGDSAGIKLKESGTSFWHETPAFTNSNSTGFSARGGGYRTNNESLEFKGLNAGCYFWTATKDSLPNAWHVGLFYDVPNLFISPSFHPDYHGFSIRCIKAEYEPGQKRKDP